MSSARKVRVKLYHDGATITSDRTLLYSNDNNFKANGKVYLKQGDSLELKSDHLYYDGNKGKAKAWGKVILKQPDMTLKTDTLYLDRILNVAYYDSNGIINERENTLKSKKGTYYIKEKKYRFKTGVKINNPKYYITSENLDYNLIQKMHFFWPNQNYRK